MTTTPDFSRRRVPPAAPAATPVPLPRMPQEGQLLRAGQIYVSDPVKAQLEPLGWKEGDPLPGNLSEKLATFRQELQAEDAAREASRPKTGTSIRPSQYLNIQDMPAEYQQQIANLLQEAKLMEETVKQREQREAERAALVPKQAHPSVAAAIQAASDDVLGSEEVLIVDDRQEPAARETKAYVPPRDPTQPPIVDNPPHDHDPATGGGLHVTHCPRCQWDLGLEFSLEITEEDKARYVAAILGGTRFTKTYALLGGNLAITFRGLTAVEARLVFQQLGHDSRAGKIAGFTEEQYNAQYLMAMMDYRLALSVASLSGKNGVILADVPEIAKIPYDPPEDGHPETPVVPMQEFILNDVLTSETLRRAVGQHHRQFQRLVEAMEAMTGEPSFWQGIA